VKPPPNFTEGFKWKPFKAATIAYFNSLYSCKHHILLTYVIREHDEPILDVAFESNLEGLIMAMTPLLEGMEFEEDSGRVHDYLNT
jgi:hypothetical protein